MSNNGYRFTAASNNEAIRIQSVISQLIVDYGCASVADLKELLGMDGTLIPIEERDIGWVNIPVVLISNPDENGFVEMLFPDPILLGRDEEPKETVDHPDHYQSETGLEAWDVIEAFTSDLKGIEAFDTGNVLKYMCRWKSKNGLEDLKKAARYLKHLIDHVEKIEKENDRS